MSNIVNKDLNMAYQKKKFFIFGSSRMGGVRVTTSSLRDSLEYLGHSVEYIHGLKTIKFIIPRIFDFTFSDLKKKNTL